MIGFLAWTSVPSIEHSQHIALSYIILMITQIMISTTTQARLDIIGIIPIIACFTYI